MKKAAKMLRLTSEMVENIPGIVENVDIHFFAKSFPSELLKF